MTVALTIISGCTQSSIRWKLNLIVMFELSLETMIGERRFTKGICRLTRDHTTRVACGLATTTFIFWIQRLAVMRQAGWHHNSYNGWENIYDRHRQSGLFYFCITPRWADDDKYALCDFTKYAGAVIGASGT